jgi:hypothetical protein
MAILAGRRSPWTGFKTPVHYAIQALAFDLIAFNGVRDSLRRMALSGGEIGKITKRRAARAAYYPAMAILAGRRSGDTVVLAAQPWTGFKTPVHYAIQALAFDLIAFNGVRAARAAYYPAMAILAGRRSGANAWAKPPL